MRMEVEGVDERRDWTLFSLLHEIQCKYQRTDHMPLI